MSAWNVGDIPRMKLPPCHAFFQFYVADGRLSCQLYQRSADIFLGVPFNIASYALLTHMVAQQCDLGVGDFVWTGGDCHLYLNHLEQVETQLARTPLPAAAARASAASRRSLFDYAYDDIEIVDYQRHPGDQGAGRGLTCDRLQPRATRSEHKKKPAGRKIAGKGDPAIAERRTRAAAVAPGAMRARRMQFSRCCAPRSRARRAPPSASCCAGDSESSRRGFPTDRPHATPGSRSQCCGELG